MMRPAGGVSAGPKRDLLRVLLLAPALFLGLDQAGLATEVPLSAPALSWEKDFKTALKQARALGKPVLVDFWADWCEWCKKLDATTYRDPAVIALVRDFVPAKVNTEGSLAEAELATQYGADTLPTIGFVSPGGRLYLRRSSFEGPDRFPATLEEARKLGRDVIAFDAVLARDGKDPGALAGLGALLADQKLYAESLDLLRAARKADAARPAPERKRTRRALAQAERARGKRADAERLLGEALAILPGDPDEDASTHFDLGQLGLDRGQAERARAEWQRAIEMAPEAAAARRAREALAGLPPR